MQEKVKEALDKVRVSLQADGGDVELIGVDDKGEWSSLDLPEPVVAALWLL